MSCCKLGPTPFAGKMSPEDLDLKHSSQRQRKTPSVWRLTVDVAAYVDGPVLFHLGSRFQERWRVVSAQRYTMNRVNRPPNTSRGLLELLVSLPE